jgi:hypothetical protein
MYNRNNMTINNKRKQTTSAVVVVAVAMGYWKSFDHEVTVQT